jgi:hypothetical protein
MLTAVILVLLGLALVAVIVFRARSGGAALAKSEESPVLEAWVRHALAQELAVSVGKGDPDEKVLILRTLEAEPEPRIVSAIEEKVRSVELEFTRYAHESGCDVVLHVRYEDKSKTSLFKRLELADVPEGVRRDFETKATTRAFRAWDFPWARTGL